MYPCEYCIDPYNTEDTGSHDDNDCRNDGLTESTGGCNRTVHKSRYTVGKGHDLDPLHAGIDYCCVCSEQRQKLMPENKEEQS